MIFCVHACVHMYFVLCVYVHFIAVFVAVATRLTLTIARCALRAACCVLLVRQVHPAHCPGSGFGLAVRLVGQTNQLDMLTAATTTTTTKNDCQVSKSICKKAEGETKCEWKEREGRAGRGRESKLNVDS